MKFHPFDGTIKFIRFGKFKKSSRMGLDAEFLDDIGSTGFESGVSVYFAFNDNDKYYLYEPEQKRAKYGLGRDYWGHMFTRVLNLDNIFLVEGDLIETISQDEEEYFDKKENFLDLKYKLEYTIEDYNEGLLTKQKFFEEKEKIEKEMERIKYLMKYTYETGSDGEPLLKNVRIIKKLNPEDVLINEKFSLQNYINKQ